jgi:delta-aminolevulinic acid dehydratase/porphobilinogen synthase
MVTPGFITDCAKKFIVKLLRAIRTCMTNIKVTKSPGVFYSSIPPMIEHLDELIKIEPYYDMSRPTPSQFKKDFETNRAIYSSNMVKRYIHEVKQHIPPPGNMQSVIVRKYFQDAFDEIMGFEKEMQNDEKNLLDIFYNGIFKRNYKDPVPDAETDETEYEDIVIEENAGEEDTNKLREI